VNKNNKLASQLAVGLALATLVGTSAFAESRHSDETRSRIHRGDRPAARAEGRSSEQQPQRAARDAGESRSWNRSGERSDRNRSDAGSRSDARTWDRSRNDSRDRDGNRNGSRDNRSYDRNRNDRRDSTRNDNRNDRTWDHRNDNRYDHRNDNRYDRRNDRRNDNRYDHRGGSYDRGHQPYYTHGRVSRLERYHGGYRVWIGGGRYPFFVPEVRFRLFPIRVGLDIRIGGYYNPLGYYDYYEAGPYTGQVYTSGALRGIVESVDYRRGTLVLRDDLSGSFVTVLLTRGDRLMDDLRRGDYVDLTGAWTRSGVFEAYRVAGLDADGYQR